MEGDLYMHGSEMIYVCVYELWNILYMGERLGHLL